MFYSLPIRGAEARGVPSYVGFILCVLLQADAVDLALRRRIDEVQEAKARLEEELKRVTSSFFNWEQGSRGINRF